MQSCNFLFIGASFLPSENPTSSFSGNANNEDVAIELDADGVPMVIPKDEAWKRAQRLNQQKLEREMDRDAIMNDLGLKELSTLDRELAKWLVEDAPHL